jgi:predicted metalloprotease with PDZ domain
MRRLWQEFGKPQMGYTEQDYQRLTEEVAGQSLETYFTDIIYGTVPIQDPLNQALRYVGCTLQKEVNAGITESRFGFRTILNGSSLLVGYIEPGSPAAKVLAADDELIAVDGWRIEGNIAVLLLDNPVYEISLFRNKQLRTVTLAVDGQQHLDRYTLRKLTDATPAQKQNFKVWLKQKFE